MGQRTGSWDRVFVDDVRVTNRSCRFLLAPFSVNQRLPSGPAAIPTGAAPVPLGTRKFGDGCEQACAIRGTRDRADSGRSHGCLPDLRRTECHTLPCVKAFIHGHSPDQDLSRRVWTRSGSQTWPVIHWITHPGLLSCIGAIGLKGVWFDYYSIRRGSDRKGIVKSPPELRN